MKYSLSILPRAQKELAQIPSRDYTRLVKAINDLGDDHRPAGCRKLTDREGWRIRVGDFRVIYEIDDDRRSITILHVGNRRDVYR
jgi:mRNA interferase RelE/StbE